MEAIVLAGGLGTRLRSVVSEQPKAMAAIQGTPFIEYLLDYLIKNGVTKIILSVGYKSKYIENHIQDEFQNTPVIYAKEKKPLGTGGALKNALQFTENENIIVTNGDSLFFGNLRKQYQSHLQNNAEITLALKPMQNYSRYGTIKINKQRKIKAFLGKKHNDSGLINSGLYVLNKNAFLKHCFPSKFSLEKDYFEKKFKKINCYGYEQDAYFLDIGIPKDFKRAQMEIGVFSKINKKWTLFLDRDGVINKKRENDYVKKLDELELIPGSVGSIASLSKYFGKVIVVTNQQGIGKGLMLERDLDVIHSYIKKEVVEKNGRIDAFYHAPQLASENSVMRKPEIGMALKAKKEFSEIDFNKSIMVGDSNSDMQFAHNAGMWPVLIRQSETQNKIYGIDALKSLTSLIEKLN